MSFHRAWPPAARPSTLLIFSLDNGGVRVPLIARWPGVVKAGGAAAQPVISIDFFPTFLQPAESKENLQQPRDGVSLVPLLKSSGKTPLKRELYWNFPGYLPGRTTPVSSIRSGDLMMTG